MAFTGSKHVMVKFKTSEILVLTRETVAATGTPVYAMQRKDTSGVFWQSGARAFAAASYILATLPGDHHGKPMALGRHW